MTSRIRRIVLAMYGHAQRESMALAFYREGVLVATTPYSRSLYHDLTSPDPIIADLSLSPLAPGNYGMPCA